MLKDRFLRFYESLERNPMLYLIGIIVFSLAIRLLYVALFEATITTGVDPWYFIRTAESIVAGNGYRVNNLMAYQPPLYAGFLAAVFAIFGNDIEAVRIIQSIVGAGMCLIVYHIGVYLVSARVGLIAAAISAVYPALINYSVQIWSEQVFTFLILLTLLLFILSKENKSVLLSIACGISIGLSALTREVGLLLLFSFYFYGIISGNNYKKSIKRYLLITIFAILTIAPWSIRNYLTFNKFVPISTNGGINFYIGNNPRATGTFNWALPLGVTWDTFHPQGIYETEASALGYSSGFNFIKENPVEFVKLTFKRAFYLFRPPYWVIHANESLVETLPKLVWLIMYIMLFITAFIVFPIKFRRRFKAFSLIFSVMFVILFPHLIVFGGIRYMLPAIPLMALISASVFDVLIRPISDNC